MGQKRGNDKSQFTKEENDALESQETETKYGINLADSTTLRKRRIISVSGKGRWAKSGAAVPKPQNPTQNSNVFGGLSFASSSSVAAAIPSKTSVIVPTMSNQFQPKAQEAQKQQQQQKSSSNPFASISFANPSQKPQFPPVHTSTNNENSSASANNSTGNVNTEMSSKPPLSFPTGKSNNEEASKLLKQLDPIKRKVYSLNRKFCNFLESESQKSVLETSEWSDHMHTYIRYSTKLQKDEEIKKQQLSNKTSSLPFPLVSLTTPKPTNNANKFQIPNTSTSDVAMAPSPAPALSFASGTASSKPFTGFSFASTTTSTSTTSNSKSTDDSDAFPLEKAEEVLSDKTNTDEIVVYAVRAKHYKFVNQKWNDHGVGKIQLYQHKTKANFKRLIMRNSVGKVQLNVSIGKGMSFQKTARKKNKGDIQFAAVLEAGKNPVPLMIIVKLDDLNEFHSKLEEMAA